MTHLPEPRRFYGGSVTDELARAAKQAADADPLERPRAVRALQTSLVEALRAGSDACALDALRSVADAKAYRTLFDALAQALDEASAESDVVARAFALPVVLVVGSQGQATLPGRLRDVSALQSLFERMQALGPTRSFGLADALCTLEALEALPPLAIVRAARELKPDALATLLPPAPIHVQAGHEQTHLRFVLGMSLTAAHSPSFSETAAHVGAWGLPCAQLLQSELAVAGVQLLALPRPPANLLHARHSGRCVQLETALTLFTANALRRFRFAVGDPVAIVSAHVGGEIRLSLSSPFAHDLAEGFVWPLHPYDRLDAVQKLMLDLLADVRVGDVRMVERLLPAQRPNGAPWYPRCDEWDALAA